MGNAAIGLGGAGIGTSAPCAYSEQTSICTADCMSSGCCFQKMRTLIHPRMTGIGLVFAALLQALARNPSLRGQLFQYTILGFAFVEAMGLFDLMVRTLGITFLTSAKSNWTKTGCHDVQVRLSGWFGLRVWVLACCNITSSELGLSSGYSAEDTRWCTWLSQRGLALYILKPRSAASASEEERKNHLLCQLGTSCF